MKKLREYKLALALMIVFFLLGVGLVLPVFSDKTGIGIIQEILSGSNRDTISPLGDDPPGDDSPEPFFYENFTVPNNSFGMGNTTFKTVNWSYFKELFLAHNQWLLEYKRYSDSEWTDGSAFLDIERTWNDSGFWKFNLVLDVPVNVYSARFTFACDLPVLDYVKLIM